MKIVVNGRVRDANSEEKGVVLDLRSSADASNHMPRTEGSFREFMDLFTQDEQLAIAGAAMTNPAIKLWYDRALGGTVRLHVQETADGLAVAVAEGLITRARADEILAADYDAG